MSKPDATVTQSPDAQSLLARLPTYLHLSDIQGLSQLATQGVLGVTGLAESVQGNVYKAVASPFGLLGAKFIAAAPGASGVKPSGITGLVYGGIKGITRLAGGTVNAALTRVGPLITERFGAPASSSEREAVLAAINGVLGDQLLATANPLTINMSFRHEGKPLLLEKAALAQRLPQATGKLLVLAHGLCMNDLQWAPAQTAMQMYSPKRSATPRFTCTTTRGCIPLPMASSLPNCWSNSSASGRTR